MSPRWLPLGALMMGDSALVQMIIGSAHAAAGRQEIGLLQTCSQEDGNYSSQWMFRQRFAVGCGVSCGQSLRVSRPQVHFEDNDYFWWVELSSSFKLD